jgi:hypothetical protein
MKLDPFWKSYALLIAIAQLLIAGLFVLIYDRGTDAPAAREEAFDVRKLRHDVSGY